MYIYNVYLKIYHIYIYAFLKSIYISDFGDKKHDSRWMGQTIQKDVLEGAIRDIHGRPLHHLLSGWYMKINQLLGSTKAFLETTNEINEHLPPNIQSVHCYSIAGKMRKRHSAKSERQDMS